MRNAWQDAWLEAGTNFIQGFFTHNTLDKQRYNNEAAFHFGRGIPSATIAAFNYWRRNPGIPGSAPGPSGSNR